MYKNIPNFVTIKVKALVKQIEVRDDKPGVGLYKFGGHAKSGLDDGQLLAGSPSKRLKLSACQTTGPSSSSSSPTPAHRRCKPRSTGAWWRKRSQSDTPTKPPEPAEASTSSVTRPSQTGMPWDLTMASRGTVRAAKTGTWPRVPPCPSSGSLRDQIYSDHSSGSLEGQI